MRGAAVILAAGRSSRMGRPKALLGYGKSNFVRTILGHLQALGLDWVGIVSGPGQPFSFAGMRLVINREPERGQLHSVRLALAAGAAEQPFLMVALVDQPSVRRETYRALVDDTAHEADLWAPSYQGRRGHPLIFSERCYPDLLAAPEEEGMRWVVARHRERRREVPVEDEEVLRDVDTPQDYEELLKRVNPDQGLGGR